jgi:hypothetical protein
MAEAPHDGCALRSHAAARHTPNTPSCDCRVSEHHLRQLFKRAGWAVAAAASLDARGVHVGLQEHYTVLHRCQVRDGLELDSGKVCGRGGASGHSVFAHLVRWWFSSQTSLHYNI